jgi:hypothetical protein
MKIPAFNLHTFFPFLHWWPTVNRHTLRDDLVAGATGALVVLPQGVAFATIAGLPPEYGLYAAMVPTVIAAMFRVCIWFPDRPRQYRWRSLLSCHRILNRVRHSISAWY